MALADPYVKIYTEHPDLFKYSENPSADAVLAAIKADGSNIQYAKFPLIEACYEAVNQDGNNIRFIERKTKILQLIAIKRNPEAIQWITNPDQDVIDYYQRRIIVEQ